MPSLLKNGRKTTRAGEGSQERRFWRRDGDTASGRIRSVTVKVLLVSTYELGHQPLAVAAPAGVLRRGGHEVRALDLSVQPYDPGLVDWCDALAVSVPMHTAMRLGTSLARRVRDERPELPICFYGLYAAVGRDRTVGALVDRAIVGEYEPQLLAWVNGIGAGDPTSGVTIDLGRYTYTLPARDLLPPLERYAHLRVDGNHRVVGYVEASHGCRHRCRHCPVPVVYDGIFRIVGVESVLADVEQLVLMGARHITFGDPDFLNGPAYALRVVEAVHSAFPDLTMDLTVKVSHLLESAELLPRLVRSGTLFVVSAFETVSDRVLTILDKGHSATDMARAVVECRAVGLDIHPSWMPFTPWSTPEEILGIFQFLADHDLVGVTDPVQLSIRLLVPEGSLLVDRPEMGTVLGAYDRDLLTYRWASANPDMDAIARELASIAARDADRGSDHTETILEMWKTALAFLGGDVMAAQIPAEANKGRPRLTEPWFC